MLRSSIAFILAGAAWLPGIVVLFAMMGVPDRANAETLGLTLTWNAERADYFHVRWKLDSQAWKPQKKVTVQSFDLTQDVKHDQTITFSVRSCNEVGCSGWAELSYKHTVQKPLAPKMLKITFK